MLALKICDPACGSGHFLVAAARRIAVRLAKVRSGDEEPAPEVVRASLRDVVGRCIYGVDINEMAVELCKVSLWMEALEPGKPLSFLKGHILQGNSLLGTTPALMARGIPDEAFKPIEGDDKKVASALKKQNKQERGGQMTLFESMAAEPRAKYHVLARRAQWVDRSRDDTLAALEHKEQEWDRLQGSPEQRTARDLANAWCAAFVWPKTPEMQDFAVTEDLFRAMKRDITAAPQQTRAEVRRLAHQYSLFHWHLAFPQVFFEPEEGQAAENEEMGWSGGFDVVLGNPPWDRIKLQEKEFFATRSPEIAGANNAAARKKRIRALAKDDPDLWDQWLAARREAEGASHLVRDSERYPRCGRGDVNTYSIFAELNRTVIGPRGRVGCIVPTGIATDDTTKFFFRDLMERQSLVSLFGFWEIRRIFIATDSRDSFALVTLTGPAHPHKAARVAFDLRSVGDLGDDERQFTLTAEDIALLNPNTGTCPVFRTRRDAEITKGIYRRVPVLVREAQGDRPEENPWGVTFMAMFHMANDSGLFRTRDQLEAEGWQLAGNIFCRGDERYLPLYEAKLIHHFNHRFGDYRDQHKGSQSTSLPDVPVDRLDQPEVSPLPRYWISEAEVDGRIGDRWDRNWLVGWRDICRAGDERTIIATALPRVGVGHTIPLFLSPLQTKVGLLGANLSAFVADFAARQKVGGTHLTYGLMNQLPLASPDQYEVPCRWATGAWLGAWMLSRSLELTYTAWDLESFARDVVSELVSSEIASSGDDAPGRADAGLAAYIARFCPEARNTTDPTSLPPYSLPPFKWRDQRRHLLRAELDAAFFHLYGIAHDDVDYIMDTFPIVRRKDEKAHGEYRTKRVILEVYDEMQRAMDTGQPYQTRLDPPPAHPSVAHPESTRPAWAAPAPANTPAAAPPAPSVPWTELPAAAWARPGDELSAGAVALQLSAILRLAGGPIPEREARLAAVLALHPRLVSPFLEQDDAAAWQRVVGPEAAPLRERVRELIPREGRFWGDAVRFMEADRHLIQDYEKETWAPGPALPAEPSDLGDWAVGRAGVVLEIVRRESFSALRESLPEELGRIADGRAA